MIYAPWCFPRSSYVGFKGEPVFWVMTRKPRQLGLPYFQNKNLAMTGVVKNIPTSGPTSLVMHIQTDQLIRRLGLGLVFFSSWMILPNIYISLYIIYPIGSMVLLYMVTWIPSIYPSHVSIYTSTSRIRHGYMSLVVKFPLINFETSSGK